ncbi:type III secretion protein D [Pseudomonas sp. JAI115]|uniref:type III secretion system inner membrane ring subunit SctD n=1 Tax=Pseudomonas sp. JAI115 TaxID=2723061 RepID=UPI00160A413B|nr:type III secretion system inner membrane ring subunit SctD [Pseudomonas sp. JAI115]MBB6155200.1 type III secretion protein D [Pseudomonas sp. JAI115]
MQGHYQLKWLNGLLAGRELRLPEGELQLGGPDADIALALEDDAQAVLVVDAQAVRLRSPASTWIEGALWQGEQPLPLGKVIDLGGQAFVLGRIGDSLPALTVPTRGGARSARGGARLGWVAAVLMMMLFGMLLWQPAPPVVPVTAHDWLAEQLLRPDLAGLTLARAAQGGLTLRGVCQASSSLDGLRGHLRERGLHLYDESVCADQVLDGVRAVLALNGYADVEVGSEQALDRVVIWGNIAADARWQRTAEQLKAIAALQGFRVVNDHETLFNELYTQLSRQALLEGLSLHIADGALRVSGQLTPQREAQVKEALEAFNQPAPRLPAVFQNLPAGAPTSTYLPAAIVGVGGNRHLLYLQLANGMRLQAGSVLPSGYRISTLSRSAVVLLKGQELVSVPLEL